MLPDWPTAILSKRSRRSTHDCVATSDFSRRMHIATQQVLISDVQLSSIMFHSCLVRLLREFYMEQDCCRE